MDTITMERPYTFRTLNASDTFLMMRIIGKIGVKEFASCMEADKLKQIVESVQEQKQDQKQDDVITAVGFSVILELVGVITNNLPKCENEIYQLLANVSGQTVDHIRNMSFIDFTTMVVDFVKKEEFRDFIKVASKLF
jgi:hypothetical protein